MPPPPPPPSSTTPVPGHPPEPGNVYGASPHILPSGDAHNAKRRIAALEAVPHTHYWKAIGRTTSANQKGDLHSPAEPGCNLDKDGWWSMRYLHTVEEHHFGNPVLCPFWGQLSDVTCKQVLDYYEANKYG